MEKTDQTGAVSVLVAESHRMVAQALTQLVGLLGYARVDATVTTRADVLGVGQKLRPDIALIDLDLSPNCELVASLHSACPDIRIIMLADRAQDNTSGLVQAMAHGAVGAIYKESSFEELGRALEFSSAATPIVPDEATGLLLDSYLGALADKRDRDIAMIKALASAVEMRDFSTGQHLHRVTELADACLKEIDKELAANEDVSFGFMLHDVGKIGIPDAILNKPGPLNDSEWQVMQRHPELGLGVVAPTGLSSAATDIILCHHERWDGEGYPNRLSGEDIPLAARVFSVADAYDAMTSDRPYRAAMSHGDAMQIITGNAGRRFDPDLVDVVMTVAGKANGEAHYTPEVIDLTA
ncbi:MAG: HD domain-containing protein [Actinomycetota bacterium]|nr:HD domain-containing protein [Actinomycetota bacterium]